MKLIPAAILASLALSPTALAQPFAIDWNTIEPGGRVTGGTFDLFGIIGQPDAGPTLTGGTFALSGGFLTSAASGPACPADLDDDGNFTNGGNPDGAVTIDDLLFFLVAFEDGSLGADLDNDGDPSLGVPDSAVTIEDLLFFLARFELGC